jgi:hypothetical protein
MGLAVKELTIVEDGANSSTGIIVAALEHSTELHRDLGPHVA